MSNVQTVKDIYDAFSRGDLPGILPKFSEKIEWEYGSTTTSVPWLQPRQGLERAAGFFASLAEIEIHSFVPKEFFEGDGVVVVLIDVDFTVKKTGRRLMEEDEIHVWRFDKAGKIVRFRHGADTHRHYLAYEEGST